MSWLYGLYKYMNTTEQHLVYSALEKSNPPVVSIPLGNETVLLVENDSSMRDYLSWTLRQLGYKVVEAKDGHEALCLLHNTPNRRIDLLLAEATMPRMGGKQLAHKVSDLIPKLRILIVSAFPQELAIHSNLLDAEIAFIQKPVTRQSLAIKVREVLDAAFLDNVMSDSEDVLRIPFPPQPQSDAYSSQLAVC